MRTQIWIFIVAAFCLLTLSRCLLAAWQWPRVRQAGGLLPILKGGVRIDANQIAVFAGIPALLAPWLGHFPWAVEITGWWLQIAWFLLVLLEVSTPQFIYEYDTRPNRLYVEYLKHPQEVFGMLWKGYKAVIIGGVIVLALFVWAGHGLFGRTPADAPMTWWLRPLYSLAAAAITFLAIRGTLGHRPINPATVAYCGDSMLNTLPLNSLYNVAYAVYSMKNERSAADVYGGMPAGEMHDIVNRCAGLLAGAYAGAAIATATGTGTGTGAGAAMSIGEGTGTATATGAGTGTSAAMPTGTGTGTGTGTAQNIPSLHLQEPSVRRERPLNVVLIVEESLGAQYTGVLGGAGLTPEFDRLAGLGWNFTQAYATGTRSVRGLEAVVAGFPPTVSDAALRLPDAQSNFFTLAQALRRQGYRSRFIYGGEAHFDNMKSFFFGNGFDDLYDRATFENPAFVGTWGASDEDMFAQLDRLLSNPPNQPTLTLAFSVTNHSPWEYPQGRIEPLGEPASVENTVRYADWALGRFFDKAMRSDYWKDTVFLVVADHDSRVFGASLVPLRHFHIPALILGADVPARSDERLISQIDLPPTLLSLAGIRAEHPMIGHDLCRAEAGGRALMQYSDNYGYLRDDRLLVLEPHRPPSQYRYTAPETYEPAQLDPELAREAQAHVLWPAWMYKNRRYTLPPSRSTA